MDKKQLSRIIDDTLRLRWAKPEDDAQLVELAFQVLDEGDEIHPFVRIFVQDWIDGKFPLLKHEDITVVEDTTTEKIVSSMCLFSDSWKYGDVAFKVGRPELVMTHPEYRRRGLIKTQFDVIHKLSMERGEVMQVITGIPSLYRQFGYELCLDLGGGYRIYPPSFPKLSEDHADDYTFCEPTSIEDQLFVRNLHQENTSAMLFSMDVPEAHWEFEFDRLSDGSDGKFHWLIIKDNQGEPQGYLHHDHIFWGPVMDINFLALKPGIGYLNLSPHLLHNLWKIAQKKFVDDTFQHPAEEVQGLYLRLGRDHPIYDTIGRDIMLKAPPYAWYVRFPSEVAYLNAIKPQLETHLAGSQVTAGFSGEFKINLYKRGIKIIMESGKLKIESWKPDDGSSGDAHFPVNSFWYLLCGQKTASQQAVEIADCWMNRTARTLLDVLFPPFTGQVWVLGGGG